MLINISDDAHLLPPNLLRHRLLLHAFVSRLRHRQIDLLLVLRHVLLNLGITLIVMRLVHLFIELIVVARLLRVQRVVLHLLHRPCQGRPALDIVGVVRVRHSHDLLRLVGIQLLDRQLLRLPRGLVLYLYL